MHSRCLGRALLLLLGLGSGPGFAAQGGEHEVRAAFIYNFALFTEWPGGRGELSICSLGESPVRDELNRYAGRDVQGRRVSVRAVANEREARACQVLYIADSEHGRMGQIHAGLANAPVLTVTEANGFDRSNVMIVMTPAKNKLAFEVNQVGAQAAGLKFSSKLLRLASRVF